MEIYEKQKENNCLRNQKSRENMSTPEKNKICLYDQKQKAEK